MFPVWPASPKDLNTSVLHKFSWEKHVQFKLTLAWEPWHFIDSIIAFMETNILTFSSQKNIIISIFVLICVDLFLVIPFKLISIIRKITTLQFWYNIFQCKMDKISILQNVSQMKNSTIFQNFEELFENRPEKLFYSLASAILTIIREENHKTAYYKLFRIIISFNLIVHVHLSQS